MLAPARMTQSEWSERRDGPGAPPLIGNQTLAKVWQFAALYGRCSACMLRTSSPSLNKAPVPRKPCDLSLCLL